LPEQLPKTEPDLLQSLSLKQVLGTIPSGLFLVDRQMRVVYWNAEAERITGYSAAEATGQHCSFLQGVECGRGCGLYSQQISKPIIGATCRINTKDGRQITLSKNVDYLLDDGEIIGGIESFIDITGQQHLERQLRQHASRLEEAVAERTAELEQEKGRLNSLLEAMDDFAYIVNDDYRVSYMNRAMIAQFGDLTGTCCFESFHQLSTPCPNCPLGKIKSGEVVREERYIPSLGQTHELLHTPLKGADGSTQKLAVCRDISERKQAEEELRAANQELDSFVRTVSHDLRSPLAPIIGIAEFLLEEHAEALDDQARDLLGDIGLQGQRMLRLLEDLLLLAQVGKLEAPTEPVLLNGLIEEVVEEIGEDLPTATLPVTCSPLPGVRLPETLLRQLFANLIGNAMRYAQPSGKAIEISGQRTGKRLCFRVRDHGPGIPDTEREKVFELFYRGSTGRKLSGTGIGLATVRKIARLYNGRCWVEAPADGGCCIVVELQEPD